MEAETSVAVTTLFFFHLAINNVAIHFLLEVELETDINIQEMMLRPYQNFTPFL